MNTTIPLADVHNSSNRASYHGRPLINSVVHRFTRCVCLVSSICATRSLSHANVFIHVPRDSFLIRTQTGAISRRLPGLFEATHGTSRIYGTQALRAIHSFNGYSSRLVKVGDQVYELAPFPTPILGNGEPEEAGYVGTASASSGANALTTSTDFRQGYRQTLRCSAAAGTFKLGFAGEETADIAASASASQVEAALELLGGIKNATVTFSAGASIACSPTFRSTSLRPGVRIFIHLDSVTEYGTSSISAETGQPPANSKTIVDGIEIFAGGLLPTGGAALVPPPFGGSNLLVRERTGPSLRRGDAIKIGSSPSGISAVYVQMHIMLMFCSLSFCCCETYRSISTGTQQC